MQSLKPFIATLTLIQCAGCTTYSNVSQKAGETYSERSAIHSSCSDLVFEPGRDVKVGDEIRYQTCDGFSSAMNVTTIDSRELTGNDIHIQLSEIKSLEIKHLSVAKTALYGLAGGTVALASVGLIFGIAVISALPHLFVGALFGG